MDAVRTFNNELSSLYENRPPVSRAKMAHITKCAIKAIKFYKHVVQSVEKFIQKCKPEYKVPGLYVVDSIVRQSRHQFGAAKDVFAPRFTKNIVNTFIHLFKCPVEERSRIVRVLNLWQKNSVFPMEVNQAMLDLAADPNNNDLIAAAHKSVNAVVSVSQKVPLPGTQQSQQHSVSSNGATDSSQLMQQTEMLSTITKLLQQAQDGSITATAPEAQLHQLQQLQQQLVMQTERITKPQESSAPIDSNLLAQIQTLTNQLLSKPGGGGGGGGDAMPDGISAAMKPSSKPSEPLFNKKLLDFDYGDSDEEDQDHHHHHPPHHHQQMHQQQQQMMHHHQQQRPPPPGLMMQPPPQMQQQGGAGLLPEPPGNMMHQIHQMNQQQEELQGEIGAQEQLRRRLLEQQQQQFDREIGQMQGSGMMGQGPNFPDQENQRSQDRDFENDRDNFDNRDRGDRRRRRSRSRSPRRRGRRSRSRSRDRRRRSRSRDRHRRSRSRDRDNSRRDREKERERKKNGLPNPRDGHISICTTTLWFGHLTKHTTEEELREHIENYGTIKTINMIPPRGCAFVCVTKRKDAYKALDRLKGVKVNGNALKVAWAPGIGVKESMFKDRWDVDQGVTYVPWGQLPVDITGLLAGGMVDEETLPDRLKGIVTAGEDEGEEGQQIMPQPQQQQESPQQQQPPPSDMGLPSGGMNPPGIGMNPPGGGMNQPGGGMNQPGSGMNQPGGGMNQPGGGMNPMMMNQQPPMQMGLQMGGPGPGMMGQPQSQQQNFQPQQQNFQPQGMPGPGPMGMLGGPMNILAQRSQMGLQQGGFMDGGPMRSMGDMGRPGMMGPGMGGMRPGFPMGLRGPMMGGDQGPSGGMRMDGPPGGMRMNSPQGGGPPFPMQMSVAGRMPQRFPPPLPGNMRPPFFNNSNNNNQMMGDQDLRGGMAEPKEWPPDDEVNDEDEMDNEDALDSDDRLMAMQQQRQHIQQNQQPGLPPGMPPMRQLNPFSPQTSMSTLLASISRPQSPGSGGMHTMLPLRMMSAGAPPQSMLALGPGGSMRLAGGPIPHMGVRPAGLIPSHLLPQSSGTGLPPGVVGLNGPPRMPVSSVSSDIPLPDMDRPPSRDGESPHGMMGGPRPPMSMIPMQGGNNPSPQGAGSILGRGFAPMTIRPRGGAGLLGLRPGGQTGGFRPMGSRPMMRGFGRMERPPFGNRFGGPFRPPMGFFDQDDREDRDERRILPRLDDIDERPDSREGPGPIGDKDERRNSQEEQMQNDVDERKDTDERSKRASGRPSRWSDAPAEPIPEVLEEAPPVVDTSPIQEAPAEKRPVVPPIVPEEGPIVEAPVPEESPSIGAPSIVPEEAPVHTVAPDIPEEAPVLDAPSPVETASGPTEEASPPPSLPEPESSCGPTVEESAAVPPEDIPQGEVAMGDEGGNSPVADASGE